MSDKIKMIKARDEYIGLIKSELLGPGSEVSIPDIDHELISDSPNTRYSIGILYPQENKINADNEEGGRVEEKDSDIVLENDDQLEKSVDEGFVKHSESVNYSDEDNLDEEVGLATQNMPSSMGITFFAKGPCQKVNCTLEFATYKTAVATDCRIPFYANGYSLPSEFDSVIYIDQKEHTLRLTSGGLTRKKVREFEEKDLLDCDEHGIISLMYKLSDQLSKGYIREPHKIYVQLEFGDSDYIDKNQNLDNTNAKITALRREIYEDLYSLTIMLVNDDKGRSTAKSCLYQPTIKVSTKTNSFVFSDYTGIADFALLDDEE